MRINKRILLVFLLMPFCFAYACSSVPPKDYIKTSSSFETSINEMSNIAIINDLTMTMYNANEDEYISIEKSLLAASYMLDGAADVMTQKGYTVEYVLTPSVGAYLEVKDSLTTEEVKAMEEPEDQEPEDIENQSWYQKNKAKKKIEKRKKAIEKKRLESVYLVKHFEDDDVMERKGGPFYTSQKIQDDPEYVRALRDIFLYGIDFQASDTARTALSVIKERVNTRFLLLLRGNGAYVSGGKQAGEMLVSGCLTGVATGGMVRVVTYEISGLRSNLMLIDMERMELIWINNGYYTAGDPLSKEYYDAEHWGKDYLYHLPARKM